MKILSIIALLICLCVCSNATAQPMVVVDMKGNIQYLAKSGSNWKKLSFLVQIDAGTQLKMAPGSYATIRGASGSHTFVNKTANEGIVTYDKPEKDNSPIYGKLKGALAALTTMPKKMASASIYRGGELMLLPAKDEILVDKNFVFTWKNTKQAAYHFYLAEAATGSWICKQITVNDTLLAANNTCNAYKNLATNKTYSWLARGATEQSEEANSITFRFATAADIAKLHKSLDLLEADKGTVSESEYMVLKAAVYFEQQMYTQAAKTLQEGMKQQPGSELLRAAYHRLYGHLVALNLN